MAWFQAWKNVHYIRFRILNHISVPTPKWIKITSSSSVSARALKECVNKRGMYDRRYTKYGTCYVALESCTSKRKRGGSPHAAEGLKEE